MPKRTSKPGYTKTGISAHDTPGAVKEHPLRKPLQTVLTVLLVLMVVLVLYMIISSFIQPAGAPTRLNARATDNIQPLDDRVLYYDGAVLHAVKPNGQLAWQYVLGTGADYSIGAGKVVAWAGNQLTVLDKNGLSSYNDRMTGNIRMATIGDGLMAVCIADATGIGSTVRVMTHTGQLLESIAVSDRYVMDMGFFSPREQLVWILSLDTAGNAPISNLATYDPGRLSTGAVELDSTLIYRIYTHNNLLHLVDTSRIAIYDYKCVPQANIPSILVYGFQQCDVKAIGRTTYALFTPMPRGATGTEFSEIRLVINADSARSVRLLSPCFGAALGDKGTYAFGSNVVYYTPFGASTPVAHYLTYTITDFVCMLSGNRAVLISGNDVFILALPS